MTEPDIAAQRLHNQRISASDLSRAREVVGWMGAVQAQDYLYSLWAVGLRMQRAVQADIEQAIADRTILRTWPMRGTVHFVPSEDAAWMLRLLAPQIIARNRASRDKAGLDPATLTRSKHVLTQALQGRVLTRQEVYDELERAGIAARARTPVGLRGLHLIGHLALEGFLCFGPHRGKQPTFVLLGEWVPHPRQLDHDQALAELAGRYFQSHGPATEYDFAWWSGLPLAKARAGIGMVSPSLVQETLAGSIYWFAEWVPAATRSTGEAYLLPYIDEYTVAYRDRSLLADPERQKQIAAANPVGVLGPVIVIDGRIAGIWKRTIEKKRVVITTHLFTPDAHQAVAAAAERFAAFVGLPLA